MEGNPTECHQGHKVPYDDNSLPPEGTRCYCGDLVVRHLSIGLGFECQCGCKSELHAIAWCLTTPDALLSPKLHIRSIATLNQEEECRKLK
jgi:hypothetical protein